MPRKKKSDIEREQASSMVKDWEKDNGGLDDNQRATLQRMIELNSNTPSKIFDVWIIIVGIKINMKKYAIHSSSE